MHPLNACNQFWGRHHHCCILIIYFYRTNISHQLLEIYYRIHRTGERWSLQLITTCTNHAMLPLLAISSTNAINYRYQSIKCDKKRRKESLLLCTILIVLYNKREIEKTIQFNSSTCSYVLVSHLEGRSIVPRKCTCTCNSIQDQEEESIAIHSELIHSVPCPCPCPACLLCFFVPLWLSEVTELTSWQADTTYRRPDDRAWRRPDYKKVMSTRELWIESSVTGGRSTTCSM